MPDHTPETRRVTGFGLAWAQRRRGACAPAPAALRHGLRRVRAPGGVATIHARTAKFLTKTLSPTELSPGEPGGVRRKALRPPRTAAGADWLATVGGNIRRLPLLLRHMRPTWELAGVDAISGDMLVREGIRGLVWDVDGTLMRRGDSSVAQHLQETVRKLLQIPDLRHVIVSNCDERRFLDLARLFPAVPVLRAYRGDGRYLLRRRLGEEESWSPAAPSPAELARSRPVRKPDPVLMHFALGELNLSDPAAAMIVGDQRLTDIASANLAGLRSIKVPTLGRGSFPLPVRLLQRAEDAAYRLLYA